jgi:multicomponent Na+:H+ antiporter subunit B
MAMGGRFLDYSVLLHDPVAGQHIGILIIEAGVGMTVTGVMITIFHAFSRRGIR